MKRTEYSTIVSKIVGGRVIIKATRTTYYKGKSPISGKPCNMRSEETSYVRLSIRAAADLARKIECLLAR